MRIIAEMLKDQVPPLLRFYIHQAPHRRQDTETIRRYRADLVAAVLAAGLVLPLKQTIELWVLFVDPCSKDLDNLIVALFRALDGKALRGNESVLENDGQIVKVTAAIFNVH